MINFSNFLTKIELDTLYNNSLELVSVRFFNDRKRVWDDALPDVVEIISSNDCDNIAWLLTNKWDMEIKCSNVISCTDA